MTFVALALLLGGLALLFAAIENVNITTYISQWIGGK